MRKNKGLVTDLRETIDKQQIALSDQAQRIAQLEQRLSRVQGQLSRIEELDGAMQNARDELVIQMGDLRKEHQKRESDSVRARQEERERDARALNEVRAELSRFEPLEQSTASLQAEDQRQNEVLLRLQEETQQQSRRYAQREDAVQVLAERVERLNVRVGQRDEAEQELRKAQETLASRVLATESALPPLEQRLAELQGMRSEITKGQEELLETQRLADRQRAQSLTEWGRKIESFAHQIDIWTDQMRFYADQYEKNRSVLREVQELTHQISQQQDQLKQVQRIAEDQIRQEILEFRTETEQRLAQEVERRKVFEQQQASREDKQTQRIGDLEELRKQDVARADATRRSIGEVERRLVESLEHLRDAMLSVERKRADAAKLTNTDLQSILGEKG